MTALLDGIRQNNFIFVGRAGIDFFTDAGVRVEDAERVSVDLGGSAANTAAGICKLGGKRCHRHPRLRRQHRQLLHQPAQALRR